MKGYKFLSFLFLWPALCFSQINIPPVYNCWHLFNGIIGDTSILLSIYLIESGEVKGYYYTNTCENKTQLAGQMTGKTITLSELNNDKISNRWVGDFVLGEYTTFIGNKYNFYSKKSIPFKLRRVAISCGSLFHQLPLYGSDNEIEEFSKSIKTAILSNDINWIAEHLDYPFTFGAMINSQLREIRFKDKQEFKNQFSKVITPIFKENVKQICPYDLIGNSHGVMVGPGRIWIRNTWDSNDTIYKYVISSFNNIQW